MSRLYRMYKADILPELKRRYPERNVMEFPALKKIVISMGLGEGLKDKNAVQEHSEELMLLSGQKPVVTRAKKAISNFKLREDQPVGLMVTLRGQRMYDFLDRFCHIVSPRIRDFRGFSRKGDGRGSYNFGISDQQIFPEINLDKVKRAQGMNITVVTSAREDAECLELLTLLGFPFKQEQK
ncbi:MAG: 50S ribosomal protein L5 [Verrucomicrobiota bacterium]|nr:50S ribosomal protein L5 [Verrucomicrobiota bacterium]